MPLGHDFQRDPARDISPSCDTTGLEACTCSRSGCGVHNDSVLNALGHNYTPSVTMPICTSEGYTTYTCSRCDDTYTDDETPALGHDYQHDPTRDAAPDCTSAGLEAYTCSRCGERHDVTLSMLGHDYLPVVTVPACTLEGYTTHTCSRCGDSYIDDEIPALGHDYQHDPNRDVAPTCTSAGLEAYTCSRCGEHHDITLPMLGHDYLSVVTLPTCTSGGYTTHTCSRCADSYTNNQTIKRSHWLGEWIPLGNGTHKADCIRAGCSYTRTAPCNTQRCLVNGVEISFCPVCGETSTGECLKLVRDTSAKSITYTLPDGKLIVRIGTMPDGTMFGSIAFVQSDAVQQPEGRVRFSLPVADFEGYSLKLLNPDGSLIDVPVLITKDGLTFELDFTLLQDSISFPVALIKFLPMTD
jgi:DNA-directed RNA polymerase subunit RPC12/RpoP